MTDAINLSIGVLDGSDLPFIVFNELSFVRYGVGAPTGVGANLKWPRRPSWGGSGLSFLAGVMRKVLINFLKDRLEPRRFKDIE